jgi:hypothetical protein
MDVCWGDLRERHHWENLGIDRSIKLKRIFKIGMGMFGLD